ncbi:hypothetical protein BH20ACT22_BH20ACT22_18150 [soil metagenome]
MYRLILTLVLLSVAVPQPAFGKSSELTEVDVRGPGITGSVNLSREELGVVRSERSPVALALVELSRKHPLDSPADELGPRYYLAYHMNLGAAPDMRSATVAVQLYPYAEGGPLAYTPGGQELWSGPGSRSDSYRLPAGWYRYPSALVDRMHSHGLPSKAVALSVSDRGATANRLLLVALVLTFVFFSRRLRRRSVALPRRPTVV